ncbi:glycosyltransferase involved in cell wall biosynthesis [Sporosarcina luteola]|nr:glycosyltransferase involved in cell wall biosynthesis [Sporosarcina luteola]
MTKLSVLTTIFNGEKYLKDMFESVFSQTFSDFEWIIVDDGSTDNTWKKLKKYQKFDERIRLYKLDTNKGVGYANRFALSLAQGEYIAKVDVDDISKPKRFEKQVDVLNAQPDIDVVDSYVEYFAADFDSEISPRFCSMKNYYDNKVNKPWSSEEIAENLYWHCAVVNGAMMGRRKSIEFVGYSAKTKLAEDYLLFYKMNISGMKFYKIRENLVRIRISNESLTARQFHLISEANLNVKRFGLESFLKSDNRPIVIWGAGKKGKDTLLYIKKEFDIEPVLFFDSDKKKEGSYISGIEIVAPRNIEKYKILVESSYGQEEIIVYLKKYNCKPLLDYYVATE